MNESASELVQLNQRANVNSELTAWAYLIHTARVAVLAAIVFLARLEYRDFQKMRENLTIARLDLALVRTNLPSAVSIDDYDPAHDGQLILGADGKRVGFAIQTSPASNSIIGYAGATNCLILFDSLDKIVHVDIVHSDDTPEHVEMIETDDHFFERMNGLSWHQAAAESIDAVSGATLTSLAIEESIHRRLGNTQPSLRFPDAVELTELKPWFSAAKKVEPRNDYPRIFDVIGDQELLIGSFIRTSPTADSINGYQGPCDALVLFGVDGFAIRTMLRSSYDNSTPEPFVRYVKEDRKFSLLVAGKTLAELAEAQSADIEGVSGATMTSQGVMSAIQVAASKAIEPTPTRARYWAALGRRDIGTVSILGFALLMCFSQLNARRWIRHGFQLVLVVYFGFINGDLISQTLVAGWSRSGVPWRHAAGLVLLTLAAVVIPVFAKRNLYCHHVCPFGAAQQLIRTRIKRPVHVAQRLARWLKCIPALLLVVVFAVVFFQLPINLAAIEPFDAFSIRAAGLATIAVAGIGLIASCFVPMAYCQYGCPTGGLLEYLRRSRRSDRLGRRDGLAVLLLLIAVSIRLS